MKMKTCTLVLLLVLLLTVTCTEEIDVSTGNPAIPVVYCIFDPRDSVYSVLLTKTFYGERSAQDLARDTDRITLKNAKITLEAWKQGYPVWSTSFQLADYGRDSGFFSSSKGCAFLTKNVLSKTFGYGPIEQLHSIFDDFRLVVSYDNSMEAAIARIEVTSGKPFITFPKNNSTPFSLYDLLPYYIEFYSLERLYYELRFRIRYLEHKDTWIECIHEFNYRQNIDVENGKFKQDIDPNKFFSRLAENFPDSTGVNLRKFVSLDLILYGGSTAIKTFIDSYYSENDHGYKLWNCFLNGIGLFAIKSHTSITDLNIGQVTLDSLALGQYTKELKFSRWR
jgi:hypothetical protein